MLHDPDNGTLPSNDEQPRPNIRRGKGLRLSADSPSDEPGVGTSGDNRQVDINAKPKRRGKGLRLSVETASTEPQPASPPSSNGATKNGSPGHFEALEHLQLAHGPIGYRRAGSGTPLLLIHGWGASSRYWFNTLVYLADTRTSYALDLPGFGASPALTVPASIPRLAAVVIAFADALGLEQFDLNGQSFGAGVAAYLAARWPERVQKLILTTFGAMTNPFERQVMALTQRSMEFALTAAQPWLNLTQPWLNIWRPTATTLMSTPPIPQLMASWYLDQTPADGWMLREGIADLMQMDLRAHLACLASVGSPDVTAALATIRAPTLLIGGRHDRIMPPETLETAQKLIPNNRVIILEHCGHVPMIEQPTAYHQAVREFLEE
jgi:pimeloyl-ACP methyl ester carboxylesterase